MTELFEVVAKSAVYGCALVAVGAVTANRLLLPRAAGRLNRDIQEATALAASNRLRMAAFGLLVALLMRAWAHTATAFGLMDSFSPANLRIVTSESRWAGGWQLQVGAAAVLCAASLNLRSSPFVQWLRVPAVLLMCLSLPQIGHPVGHPWRVLLHTLHVAGGGVWLGTLVVAVLSPRAARVPLLRAFAPVAMLGVSLAGLAGLAMSAVYLGAPASLLASGYGRVLLLKGAAVGATLLMGALNWRTLHRRGGGASGPWPIVEASMTLVIVALTAWLSETAHP